MPLKPPQRLDAWLALMDSTLPWATTSRMVEAFESPESVLDGGAADWIALGGLRPEQAQRLHKVRADRARRAEQMAACERLDIRIVERGDAEFPARLAEWDSAPPVLFVRGDLRDHDRLAVGMVGSRLATPYGLEVARRLATQFAPTMTVVSGLAVGIDTAAHEATMAAGGRTLGVAACGLDEDYPKGNAAVRERIPSQGALVSAWPPMTRPATHHFPARNELLAALSLAVIVVEAGDRSGSLITASAAADMGRDVFAVPGDITRRNSAGANQLLAQGAGFALSARDVIGALAPRLDEELATLLRERAAGGKPSPAEEGSGGGLPPEEEILLQALEDGPRTHDELLAALTPDPLEAGALSGALLMLELKAMIDKRPGGLYSRR